MTSDAATIHRQIISKLEENGLKLDLISAYIADNASVNYGETIFCFLKAKGRQQWYHQGKVWPTKHAGDTLNSGIDSVQSEQNIQPLFSFYKAHKELKAVFAFVEEDYDVVQRHIPTRWLSLWPAVLDVLYEE